MWETTCHFVKLRRQKNNRSRINDTTLYFLIIARQHFIRKQKNNKSMIHAPSFYHFKKKENLTRKLYKLYWTTERIINKRCSCPSINKLPNKTLLRNECTSLTRELNHIKAFTQTQGQLHHSMHNIWLLCGGPRYVLMVSPVAIVPSLAVVSDEAAVDNHMLYKRNQKKKKKAKS